MRVPLVEDDVRLAAAVRRGLHSAGVVADVAGTGEAHFMVRAARCDPMVLDVMLSGIDGFEACWRLRADGIWADHHGGRAGGRRGPGARS